MSEGEKFKAGDKVKVKESANYWAKAFGTEGVIENGSITSIAGFKALLVKVKGLGSFYWNIEDIELDNQQEDNYRTDSEGFETNDSNWNKGLGLL